MFLLNRPNLTDVRLPAFKTLRAILFALFLVSAFGVNVSAQSESGGAAIEGTITDPNAQALIGAGVTIRNQETGYARKLTTDARGQFIASVMPVGIYSIEASAKGFTAARRGNVALTVGHTETINLSLKVAAVNEQVAVSADQASVETEEGATGS